MRRVLSRAPIVALAIALTAACAGGEEPTADRAAAVPVTPAVSVPSAPMAVSNPPAAGVDGAAVSPRHSAPPGQQTADNHPPAGLSLSSDNGPIDINSDSLSLDYKGKTVVFRGHVEAVQSGTRLTSDMLQVSYGRDFGDVRQVVADGNVRITQGGRWATGDHAILDQAARTVEMTGKPVLHDGPDQISGTKILVYLDSQKSVVEEARAVIFPRKQETRDNDATKDAHTAAQ